MPCSLHTQPLPADQVKYSGNPATDVKCWQTTMALDRVHAPHLLMSSPAHTNTQPGALPTGTGHHTYTHKPCA